ncbi:DUF3967 domain-containing protein [Trichococcus sp. K1Tr]|uniref:DUF3967 domain-containing protein n=1 Tax=Priestia megaterium TaxID=1404 RepID=A0AAX6BTF8_PRIMG|nr:MULTISPECIES: DUF3967 domain-containing protein [Bacilli]MCM3068410.1 helix-turn-helix domain-containing protein [Priestia flexa]MDB6354705.1 DUF3967 domain-containing protein [Trichococcus sp. K1Tr]OCW71306.1 hypothetical protein BBP13_11950 [Limosilactobacillus reuteri]GMG76990.1 hypothetical protein ShirakiTB12_54590 [Priestia megaterium]
MDHTEMAYTTKEVSKTLNVVDSTIRKWCLSLEKNGYTFTKNEHNQRLFLERDLVVLRHYQTMVKENNFSMDNAGMVIAAKFSRPFPDGTGGVPAIQNEDEERPRERSDSRSSERSDERINKLIEYAEKQEQFNKELVERLDVQQKHIEKQQHYIEERLKERDEKLMDSLRTFQETKQEMLQIAAAKEEKKGFFSRLFGK